MAEQHESSLASIRGQIERVTFSNEENGYTVAKVKVYGRSDLVTVIGNMANPTPGEILQMTGEWGNHPKYGEQFKLVFYKTVMPATAYAIEKYLGSGLIKGIGPVMARRMVKVFAEKTLDVIELEPDRLCEVPGIGKARIGMIRRAWEEQKAVREVMIFLQGHGVSSAYATKIYKQYGDQAISVVQKNPYRLAHDIFGIGFLTADRIAEKMGFDKEAPERAQAGLLYTLHEASDEGHVCLPMEELLTRAEKLLDIGQEDLQQAVYALVEVKDIVIETLEPGGGMVYLAKFHVSECQVAARLRNLLAAPRAVRQIDAARALEWVQGTLSIQLADMQRQAIGAVISGKVTVITGGPGTGKTTIIRAILKIFSRLTQRIQLAAPTGRAAKRMSEATGMEARTIHRLLEYNMARGGFMKNDESLLEADLVIVDEASMVDIILMHHLLKAIPAGSMLLLVGDVDQLPSVGAGSVLKDVIASGVVPTVTLNEIFRQAQTSAIITNAHRIIRGEMPECNSGRADNDFFLFRELEPDAALARVVDVVRQRIPSKFGFAPLEDIQVLTPMNRGSTGTVKLNEALQDALNPKGAELQRGGRKFRIGDKVMQIRNNYDKNVYNGDIGFVRSINTEEQEVHVDIDGVDIAYDYSDLDELVLAYAVSIHKSQGSEYPVVVIPLTMQHFVMLQRNLLYTAVTRGKRLVVLVGSPKALAIAVKNNKITKRYGLLSQRLTRDFGHA